VSRRAEVADQARAVAAAWSPPDAPPSWWLTADTLTAIAEDDVLLDLAAEVPTERLPALLLSAAIRRRVAEVAAHPLATYYPHPGGPQPPRDDGFRPALRGFAVAEQEALRRLCARHRYQMNEVGRCLDVLPALALVASDDHVHVDTIGAPAFDDPAPLQRDAIFRIASITKPIVAAAAMTMVDEGSLALDQPVDDLLPELTDRPVLRTPESVSR